MRKSRVAGVVVVALLTVSVLAAACAQPTPTPTPTPTPMPTPPPTPDVSFTLETALNVGGLVFAFVGRGGKIQGVVNPNLQVRKGQVVEIVVVNGDGVEHDFAIEALGVQSKRIRNKGDTTGVVFKAEKEGEFTYACTVLGHKEAGMIGKLVVLP